MSPGWWNWTCNLPGSTLRRCAARSPEAAHRVAGARCSIGAAMTAVARIQFALAGVNAHINHDLPVAIGATCRAMRMFPSHAIPQYADYSAINSTLESMVDTAKQELMVRLPGDGLPAISNLEQTLAAFSVSAAREAAWNNAEMLWAIRNFPPLQARTLDTLDGLAALAGKQSWCPGAALAAQVALDQGRGRAIQFPVFAAQHRQNLLRGEHLAQLHAELVERVDVPDHALREDAVLVQRDQRAQDRGREFVGEDRVAGAIAWKTRCGSVASLARTRGLCSARTGWPSAGRADRRRGFRVSEEADEVAGNDLGALVNQLVEGMLAVGAGFAPEDRSGLVGDSLPPRVVTRLPLLSMVSCCR